MPSDGPEQETLRWRSRPEIYKVSGRMRFAFNLATSGNCGTERDTLLDMRQEDSRAHFAAPSTRHNNLPGSAADTTGNTPWITRAEAAEILDITAGGVGYYVRRGDLRPGRKCRHLPTLNRTEVERLAETIAEERSRRRPARPKRPRHPQDGNQWLSALQVANRLGMSRLWVDIRALRGELQARQAAVGQPTG